jgi:hypothetical protein
MCIKIWQIAPCTNIVIPVILQRSPLRRPTQPYVHFPSNLSHILLTHVSHRASQLTPYVPVLQSENKFKLWKLTLVCILITVNHTVPRARVAQWIRQLYYLTTHISISQIRRGFSPCFVNYKKRCISTFVFVAGKTFVQSVSCSTIVYLTSTKKHRLTEDFIRRVNL